MYTRAGDRLNLQIVTPSSGVPDVLPADILPGLPGPLWETLSITSG